LYWLTGAHIRKNDEIAQSPSCTVPLLEFFSKSIFTGKAYSLDKKIVLAFSNYFKNK